MRSYYNNNDKPKPVISNAGDAFKMSIALLSKKSYSKKMLVKKLIQKGCTEDACQAAVSRLEELSMLNDEEYAGMLFRHCKAKGLGRLRIIRELENKGIDREITDSILDSDGGDDTEDVIKAFLLSKLKGSSPDKKEISRAVAALMRKGFKWEEIAPVLHCVIEDNFDE